MRNDKEDNDVSDPIVKHLYVGEHFELKNAETAGGINITI